MSTDECQHLEDFKADNVKTFKIIHAVFVVCTDEDSKKTKIKNAFCHICKRLGPHLHACLHCIFFGCHKHIREHTKSNKHCFSIDLNYGQVHCTKCNDYVYDSELDEIAVENKMNAIRCNKRLYNLMYFEPREEECKLLDLNPKIIYVTPDSTIGLRGLINLGATCYMNSVVQALMHTPLLKDYFLSERHKCKGSPGTCLVCELSRLFQEFYKGHTIPLALDKLLHFIWIHAKHLQGYQQQDAHEFLIAMLTLLHQHCVAAMSLPHALPMDKIRNCPCIVDQIFTGRLQSDVVCQNCNGISTTIDPISDIALDIEPLTVNGMPPSYLTDCLERYTRTENLGAKAKIMCSNCQSKQESTKKLSLNTLPIVVIFQLKRFQHFNEIKKKITTTIKFPEILDMTPFMSENKSSSPYPIPKDNRYSLFAVINHIGDSMITGHYTAYIRQQRDYWYKCNDDIITRSNLQQVLDSEGYLLFYHKHILEYD